MRKQIILFSFLFAISCLSQQPKQIFLDCAQYGSDQKILDNYFRGINNGFYVDIGAFDPIVISNTYNMHARGWSGINIEAGYQRAKLFYYQRPQAINLNVAIAPEPDKIISLYGAEDSASISIEVKNTKFPTFKEQQKVKSMTIGQICDRYYTRKPNFMNLDIQGIGSSALQKNNWTNPNCYPQIIGVENNKLTEITSQQKPEQFLVQKGYKKAVQALTNQYFIHESVYDQYMKKMKQNQAANIKEKQYYDYRIFAEKVFPIIENKNKTKLNYHSTPFTQNIYLHGARFNQIVDIQKINKLSNELGSTKNRPIVIIGFHPHNSFVLIPNRDFTRSEINIQNFTFQLLTIANAENQQLKVYILDHKYKPLRKAQIFAKDYLQELQIGNFSFNLLINQIQNNRILTVATILLATCTLLITFIIFFVYVKKSNNNHNKRFGFSEEIMQQDVHNQISQHD